jgi:amino acid transporter
MEQKKSLGLWELIAIAIGGMVGGGIFSILGISIEQIGNATPIAIFIGGILAFFAAYSYVKLALLYKDEGATYSFFKKTFPKKTKAMSIIGWLIVFGYISTLALYAYTFATYFCSQIDFLNNYIWNKIIAGMVILLFTIINIVSVKGMGKIEDILVYSKIIILLFIAFLFFKNGDSNNFTPIFSSSTSISKIFIVASITFVSYEGFQLVIHAYNEMDNPQKNIPKAIYTSVFFVTILYVLLVFAGISLIPKSTIIKDKEYALAAGASNLIGKSGELIVIFGALLATSSAISGTLFGASRLMAVIAKDGYFPIFLSKKIKTYIPRNAIISMSILAFILILSGGLQTILEFGSITFILVSFLMAYSNFVKRKESNSSSIMTIISMLGLFCAGILILYFEFTENLEQLIFIGIVYLLLIIGGVFYAKKTKN